MPLSADGSWDESLAESIVAEEISASIDYSDDFDASAAHAEQTPIAAADSSPQQSEYEYEYEYEYEEVEDEEGDHGVSAEKSGRPAAVSGMGRSSDDGIASPRSAADQTQVSGAYSDRFDSFAFSDEGASATPSESLASLSGSAAAYSDDFDLDAVPGPTVVSPERTTQPPVAAARPVAERRRRVPELDRARVAAAVAALAVVPAHAAPTRAMPPTLYARDARTRALVADAAAALRGKENTRPSGPSRLSILGGHIAVRPEAVDDVKRAGNFAAWERTIAEAKASAERPPRRACSRELLIAHATSQLRQKMGAAEFEKRRHVHASFYENGQALVADVAVSFARASRPFASVAPPPDAGDTASETSSGSAWSDPVHDAEINPAVELALSRELVARANRTLDPAVRASLFTVEAAEHAAASTERPTTATLAASRDLRARLRAEFGDTTPAFLSPRSPADAEFGLSGSPRSWIEPGTFSLDEHRATLERSQALRTQAAASIPAC